MYRIKLQNRKRKNLGYRHIIAKLKQHQNNNNDHNNECSLSESEEDVNQCEFKRQPFNDVYTSKEIIPDDPNDEIYSEVLDFKIYKGITPSTRRRVLRSANYYKSLNTEKKLLEGLTPSTLTAQGKLTNVKLDEQNFIECINNPTGYIMHIGCNWGEKVNPNYKPFVKKRKSGRGRKPKPKKVNRRKKQGSGKYFASQTTFLIRHPQTNVLFKIKLFRTGVFQVPGVACPNMHDLIEPVIILRDFMRDVYADNTINIQAFRAVMRNYKARVIAPHYRVLLDKFNKQMMYEKASEEYDHIMHYLLNGYNDKFVNELGHLVRNFHPMKIAERILNTERCPALVIRFHRPIRTKLDNKTTIKILRSGKINFDGGSSIEEVLELYHWLEWFYKKYKDTIIFDINKFDPLGKHIDSGSDTSIYDDDSDVSDISDTNNTK